MIPPEIKRKMQGMKRVKKTHIEKIPNTEKSNSTGYSVIIPAHKTENFIEQCLDSIAGQNHFKSNRNYEILLGIDSCETTLKKVVEIYHKYEKLRVFYFPKNHGPYIVKNNLIHIAQYDNLLFFDSDDHMKSEMVTTINHAMIEGYDICKTKYINYKHGTNPNSGTHKPKVADGVGCHTKRVHEVLGGYEEWPCGADSEFTFRSEPHMKVFKIHPAMFYRRVHSSSLTQAPKTNPRSPARIKYAGIIDERTKTGYYKKIRKVDFEDVEYHEVIMNGEEDGERDGFSSADYWSTRYDNGGNSGAGSRGRLATYKHKVINQVVKSNNITEVIDFGSGDGYQCSMLQILKYTGVDVSQKAIDSCNRKYARNQNWKFYHTSNPKIEKIKAPLSMSIDVIFHLVEDDIFDTYMKRLFAASTSLVLIYSSNEDKKIEVEHVNHRKYTDWIDANAKDFKLIKEWQNPYPYTEGQNPNTTSFASFKLFKKG